MGLVKKIAKKAGKAVKKGVGLVGKVAKQTPPYSTGRVIGSLARGKKPSTRDLLGMAGVALKKRSAPIPKVLPSFLKKKLAPRYRIPPVATPKRRPTARQQAIAESGSPKRVRSSA